MEFLGEAKLEYTQAEREAIVQYGNTGKVIVNLNQETRLLVSESMKEMKTSINQALTEVKEENCKLREEFKELREEFKELREEFKELREEFKGLREEFKGLKQDFSEHCIRVEKGFDDQRQYMISMFEASTRRIVETEIKSERSRKEISVLSEDPDPREESKGEKVARKLGDMRDISEITSYLSKKQLDLKTLAYVAMSLRASSSLFAFSCLVVFLVTRYKPKRLEKFLSEVRDSETREKIQTALHSFADQLGGSTNPTAEASEEADSKTSGVPGDEASILLVPKATSSEE